MSDARAWLRDTLGASHPGDEPRMRDALLAVLDECDRLDGEESGVYPGIWFDALAHASDRIHAAIDKALGVVERDDPMPWEEATWD